MFLNPKPFVVSQLSVSQLELLNRCARRWWFDRVCHIKEGETAAKSAGTGSHALLEHTVTKGEDVLGPMEAPARPYLPRPGDQVFCEWGFDDRPRIPGQHWHDAKASLLKVDGVPFIGFIDLWHATGFFVDSDGARKREQPHTAEAVDYKTTSSIQRNAKAGFQLPRTIQMSGYGAWLAARVPGVRWVRLSHVYIQTKGAPRAEKRTALITVDSALEIWNALSVPLVERARWVAQEKTQAAVPYNPDDCEAYGRQCPAFALCTRKGDRMSALSLAERLAAAKASSDTQKPASAPIRVIDETTSPDRPVAAQAGLPAGTSIVQSPVPLTVGSRLSSGETVVADLTGGQYLVRADAAPAVQAPVTTPTPPPPPPTTTPTPPPPPPSAQASLPLSRRNPETGASEFLNPATGKYESEPAGSAVAAEDVKQLPPMAAPADPPKRGRGRPPKAKDAAPAEPAPYASATTADGTRLETPRAAPFTAARFGDYVSRLAEGLAKECGLGGRGRPPKAKDAAPAEPAPYASATTADGTRLETPRAAPFTAARFGDYVSRLAEGLAKECGLDDIRLALDGSHALAFGRWKGALAVLCREEPPAPGGYIVDLAGELEAVAFEALAPRAAELGLTLFVGCFPVAPGIVRAR